MAELPVGLMVERWDLLLGYCSDYKSAEYLAFPSVVS
jgi:hypothetical protein